MEQMNYSVPGHTFFNLTKTIRRKMGNTGGGSTLEECKWRRVNTGGLQKEEDKHWRSVDVGGGYCWRRIL